MERLSTHPRGVRRLSLIANLSADRFDDAMAVLNALKKQPEQLRKLL